jgi:hypothetical protein
MQGLRFGHAQRGDLGQGFVQELLVAWKAPRSPARKRSICSLRSLPQKGSPSMMKNGAPNTPAAMAPSLACFSRAFQAGSFHTASASCGSSPNWAARALSSNGSLRSMPRVKYARRPVVAQRRA